MINDGHGYRTPRRDDLVQCKRCGQPNCVWAVSKRTGRSYLAFSPAGRGAAYLPHKCDDEVYGGYPEAFAAWQARNGAR